MTTDLEARVGNRSRRLLELMMATLMMALGVQLTLTPGEVFKAGGALQPLMWAPAIFWTMLFTILGTVRLVVVIINGVWPLSPTVRWWLCLCGMWVWASITWGYWRMLPATAGFPALVFSPAMFVVEAICLFALSALRAGRQRAP